MPPSHPSPDVCRQARTYREEILYPGLFGRSHRGPFHIPPDMFTTIFNQPGYDSTWLRCGVFEYEPSSTRGSWLYVTSGLSDATEALTTAPEAASGLGMELVLELPHQAWWAVTRLTYLMAYQLLVCHRQYLDHPRLADYMIVPLGTPIGTEESELTSLLLAPPAGFDRRQQLATGWFDFSQVVGISQSEATAAGRQAQGGPRLLAVLRQEGAFPVTIPEREVVI